MKREFVFGLVLGMVFLFSVVWADTNGVINDAEDVRSGVFGGDEQVGNSGYAFIHPVYFNSGLKIVKIYDSDVTYYVDIDGSSSLNSVEVGVIKPNSGANLKIIS